MRAALTLLFIALLLSGCASSDIKPDPAYAPARPQPAAETPVNNGAIYQTGFAEPGYHLALFEDQRARRVGDMLTITLVESTNASKEAKTNTKKKNAVDIRNPTLLGATPQFSTPGLLPLSSNRNNTLANKLDSTHDFSGSGDSSQKNSLSGSITVTVAEVLPNGYLVVRGEKLITLNQGDEYVRFSGIVRPQDIRNNSVQSTQVANAQITYAGKGQVADANALGWLARFFLSALWPF
jgi:flagellar L-ring protein precursor FlgH